MRVAGGICTLIGGIIGIGIGAFVATMGDLTGMMTGFMWFGAIGIPMIVLGVVALIGGIYALKARNWAFCLAAAIIAIFCGTIFGILGTIFIALRRSEFS